MKMEGLQGVPDFELDEFFEKRKKYCLLIPVINENGRLKAQLARAKQADIANWADIAICDGGSTDGSTAHEVLKENDVRALLVKTGPGKQGAQLRTGIWWALEQGYEGILTVDGNNKDSVENVPRFIEKLEQGYEGILTVDGNNKDSVENVPRFIDRLEQGYDFIQGSRFIEGGLGVNTPVSRHLAVTFLHAPAISLMAGQRFTDTTNAFRAYSRNYLTHPEVQPLRDIFTGYELLAYLSIRATQLGMKACEVPVTRVYPKSGKTPTKIKGIQGNVDLLKILANSARGKYNP